MFACRRNSANLSNADTPSSPSLSLVDALADPSPSPLLHCMYSLLSGSNRIQSFSTVVTDSKQVFLVVRLAAHLLHRQ